MKSKPSLWNTVQESLLVALVAMLTLGPLTGLVLNGYGIIPNPMRTIYLGLAVFTARFLIGIAGRWLKPQLHVQAPKEVTHGMLWRRRIELFLVFAVAFILPFFLNKYWLSIYILCLIYVILGLGLNIVVGLAGLLDLGYVAFYAVGAYFYALSAQYLGLSFWVALPLGTLLAGLCGMLLAFPVLRMHGDYLAIVTLGFGEIISLILLNWTDFTGGPNGVSAPFPSLFNLEFKRSAEEGNIPFHEFLGIEYAAEHRYIFYALLLLMASTFVWIVVNRLQKMPAGRAWEALRQDEIACRSLGINHVQVKLSAFALGAALGGLAGVFFAGFQGFINPSSFNFFESALILAIVVLGGLGSSAGVVIAAIALTVMPEFLREFSEYRMVIFGLLMVIMMVWRPRGLLLAQRRHIIAPKEKAA